MWTYAPSEVSISIAGKRLHGFPDGVFLRIVRNDPLGSSKQAMDGLVCITRRRYSQWNIEITLQQTSDSNNLLDGVERLLLDGDVAVLRYIPVIIKDNSGSSLFFGKDVWVTEVPEQTFSASMETRTWRITCNDVITTIGGNTDVDDVAKAIQVLGATVESQMVRDFVRGL